MKGIWNMVHGLKPVMLMVMVQTSFAVVNVLYKLAIHDGMSLQVAVAYRFIFATAFITPLALILERKNRPKMTGKILLQASLCGLFGGALAQNLYLKAITLTSATFASAMSNLIPAFTFILAASFGMERLNLETAGGKAKIIGTLTGIGGAMLLTLFKGKELQIASFHLNLLHHVASPHAASGGGSTVFGALCSVASGTSYALWLIIQTKMSEEYQSYYSSTALMSLMASILSIVFALCLERDWSQWRLCWDVRLLTVAYSGVVASGVMVVVISWCVRMRGPLFVSVFSPLMLVVVAFAGSMMLDEKLHLGSVLGAVLIVCGLYGVLWGKCKEKRKMNQLVPSSPLSESPHESDTVQVQVIVRSPVPHKTNNAIQGSNAAEAA